MTEMIAADENAWWFILSEGKLVALDKGDFIPFGNIEELPFPEGITANKVLLGKYQEQPCYLIEVENSLDVGLGEYVTLRSLLGRMDDLLFDMAGRAFQISLFYKTHQFCGQCGQTMQKIDWEIAMKCYHCQHRTYPRVSPCIIVAIRKHKKILLALHNRHQKSDRPIYTTLAGFTEAGETLEACVEREVFEEVGLKIKNIQYVTSQPWPFPHSLMMGFTADYDSGEINVDPHELIAANWYDIDDLPLIPRHGTIARKLIEKTLKRCR
ncbi:NAD(+) diphosphatase [Psychromonas sp. RZ22]|uniref:NAD(+) diphosphatase n=1 Tax=Psychromonas algarum TaxID=2555643 RepID=UPI0010674F8A|nr:NAD(+) diphosphatase [Psychromonas sp. RZ22]TEW54623.1 NAD(+) diphosphatase [Psychromonas sp. RZ22]